MKTKRSLAWLFAVVILCSLVSLNVFAQDNKSAQKKHEPITQRLITMVEHNSDIQRMLINSIEKAKKINPDKKTNPAQSLEEYYDFIDWAAKAMPWSILPDLPYPKLYEQIDQSLDYFYFINDQPLPELKGKGYYNNSLQYHEPYRTWLIWFVKQWGMYLSTAESWNEEYYQKAFADERFGLQNGWYEDPSNWKTFNDFFTRRLKSPDQRPIASPDDPSIVSAPADSTPQGVWKIDQDSNIVPNDGIPIKSNVFKSIAVLIGEGSAYQNDFANGTLTHTFLDVNDYHRYHFPIGGTIKEVRMIESDDAAGGITIWDAKNKKYVLESKAPGWQNIETRGCVIIENEKYGLVALLPIGMSQVSSVNFEDTVKVGNTVKKGDMLGYFLFGGSDFVILFQNQVDFQLTVPQKGESGYENILMGKEYGKLTTNNPISNRRHFTLDANASGVIETIDNIANMTVVSKDANDLKAEYRVGFVQGKLQGESILSARDNNWDNAYLTDETHSFPRQEGPTPSELEKAEKLLNTNYNAFLALLRNPATDAGVTDRLKRLLFRMLGIYHGAVLVSPASLDFSGNWLPDSTYFKPEELNLGYETAGLSFMDVYFLNAYNDLLDVISYSSNSSASEGNAEKCSAFLKRIDNEVILTHNTWSGFLSQTMTQTLAVNGDLLTINAAYPGLIGSGTDFGFNNKGIMFNETTHRMSKSEVKPVGLWMFWRATLAEQFSASIDDFFRYISLDNSGTYLNGYMLVDAKTYETGLVEMSYRCFIYYRSDGGEYTVSGKSMDGEGCSEEYDMEMLTPEHQMGINYPASLQVRADLQSTDNRPARRRQFKQLLPGVTDIETAKEVITYTDPSNPLSVFGRWDLGYGETDYPKQIPDGAIDAKVGSTKMVRAFMALTGILDTSAANTGFWMFYGTPYINGSPFIWSRSFWSGQKLRDVPNRLDGRFTLIPLYLR